jgi:two-component system sensor histidine kinase ChvG
VLLTREAREVDQRLLEIRVSVLALFGLALLLTVLLSLYLARTLATPILQLAQSAAAMREGEGRGGSVPGSLLRRDDEIGVLARDLQTAARSLWARIDANERFAADVAHELRNPLTSVRSAIETLRRIEDPGQAAAPAADHLRRRGADGPADRRHLRQLEGGCRALPRDRAAGGRGADPRRARELHGATREDDDPVLEVEAPERLVVRGVEEGWCRSSAT